MDRKLELLAKVPLLARVNKKDLERVSQIADEVDVAAGKVVAAQGSHGAEFFVILDGHVAVEHDGRHLADLGPGSFFGELALLANVPRTATVTATTACRLLVMGRREFRALLADHPSIQGAVLDAVAERWAATEASHPS
ncbi:N/A [soil metagenome]